MKEYLKTVLSLYAFFITVPVIVITVLCVVYWDFYPLGRMWGDLIYPTPCLLVRITFLGVPVIALFKD